jgi:branched-chain amino acid transport system ATP-binding protein
VTAPLLEVSDLTVAYGEAFALHSVDLSVGHREVVAIVGANGAGKSTLLRAISGLVRAVSGSVRFENQDIGRAPVHEIVRRGIAHIPEGRGIFAPMTVSDNLRIGGLVRGGADRDVQTRLRNWFPVLFDRLAQPAGMLSGGEQQMLAISRALLSQPRLLMIDELSLGLAPKVIAELTPRLGEIRAAGTSVLLVDQSLQLARRVADRMVLLANGRVVWSGPTAQLEDDASLMRRYLGID